jgi:hypothetical protein
MPAEIAPQTEASTQIIRIVRYAIGTTLALTILLLIIDVLALAGSPRPTERFLSEPLLVVIVLAIAGEAALAIVGVICLSLWGKPRPQ